MGRNAVEQFWDPLGADPSCQPPWAVEFRFCEPFQGESMACPPQLIRTPSIQKQGIGAVAVAMQQIQIRFLAEP